ncbi:Vacuolar protein sorting protein vps66 [Coemansia brasiliensis]|uniref:Vacuolar protein sorting protein vps66 n=1 Tax=Coemansia brasiliensis TaxID=2650707 RepID=A0A9W8LXJ2_9FUNG|nr:Vacuolar protein sorting protein vps66 [Coemansia brasiliensis]
MEKYSKWRDSGTGIQPFLQPVPARTQQTAFKSVLGAVKSYIVGPVVSVMRLASLALTVVADTITNTIGVLLVVPSIKRKYSQCTRSVLARLALFIMGFYSIDAKTVGLQRGRRSGLKVRKVEVKSGDLIIANHVSYIDVLWLVAKYNPVFVEIDNASSMVQRISMWTALRAPALQTPALLQASNARTLKSVTEEARLNKLGPVVVFPENATSNGRALLRLLPMFEEPENLDEKSQIHVMALKYPAQSFSPAYSVGSQFWHLFVLCCQVYNSLVVRILEQDECPKVKESALFCDADMDPVNLDEAVREKLLQLSRLRMTKLSAMDKRDFLVFYNKRKTGYRSNI